ncbi:MAG: hypothetical protein GXO55_04665 [Chloroflexi bacterium]|nr:hypothetical protein [Chloroflexota bacterium]
MTDTSQPPLNPDFQYIELDYSRNDKYAQMELPEETEPPRIESIQVFPYPHLTKLWIKMNLSYFKTYPNLELYLYDPDGTLLGDMLFVEHRNFYVDVTMHLRAEPRPGEQYRLEVYLIRDDTILDHQVKEFDLIFVDPETGKPPVEKENKP